MTRENSVDTNQPKTTFEELLEFTSNLSEHSTMAIVEPDNSGWWWTFTLPFGTGVDVQAQIPPNWFYRKMQTLLLGIHWEHRDG
jgi:hypothetical protein